MGNFYQYNKTPALRTNRQVATHQETNTVGDQQVNLNTALDADVDTITTYNDDYNVTVISTATTTTIKTGAGRIRQIRVVGGTLGNVTVYDNTAGSGTVLVPTVSPDKGQVLLEDAKFNTGLTIVTAAATLVVVTWR